MFNKKHKNFRLNTNLTLVPDMRYASGSTRGDRVKNSNPPRAIKKVYIPTKELRINNDQTGNRSFKFRGGKQINRSGNQGQFKDLSGFTRRSIKKSGKMPRFVGPTQQKDKPIKYKPKNKPNTMKQNEKIKIHSKANEGAVRVNQKFADNLPPNGKEWGITLPLGYDNRPTMPISVTNKTRRMEMVNLSDTRNIHSTEFVSGFNPSRAIREAARTFGTGYSVLFDSKFDYKDPTSRDNLTNGAGFNQKDCHIPSMNLQCTRSQVEQICVQGYGSDPLALLNQTSQTDRQDVYASLIRLKRQYMIHNNSPYFPMNMKISVIRCLQRGKSADITPIAGATLAAQTTAELAAVDAAIAASTALPAVFGKVPWQYQHAGLTTTGFGLLDQFFNCQFSLKGRGLWESRGWNENYKLIESFEKTIGPGDFWNFSHVHNMGGGLELGQFQEENNDPANSTTRNDPFTYLVMFETKGSMCEGVFANAVAGLDTYIGTSPVYYSYEGKVSAYYVKEKRDTDSLSTNISTNKVHRREYFIDPIRTGTAINTTKREFFVPRTSIITTNTPGAGQMFIPVASENTVQIATSTSGIVG